jgi:4-hydroxy-tetrahydrodipicolinate synthase
MPHSTVTSASARDLTRLRGSIPPLITPFIDGAVDYDTYAELVNFQIEQGSHGILVNGTTAEPSTLTTEERNRLVTLAIEVTAGRVPVVAATGSQSLAESRVLTEHAVAAGADSLLIVTPYYIRPPQRGLIAYYLELVADHDLPWMIYHIPGRVLRWRLIATPSQYFWLKNLDPEFSIRGRVCWAAAVKLKKTQIIKEQ